MYDQQTEITFIMISFHLTAQALTSTFIHPHPVLRDVISLNRYVYVSEYTDEGQTTITVNCYITHLIYIVERTINRKGFQFQTKLPQADTIQKYGNEIVRYV